MELGTGLDEDEFPPPLPPTKIPSPVTTEPMGQKFQCCVCRTTEGVLTCTRCRAVRYCDKECQKKQWPKHKDICAQIKAAFEETERTADLLKTYKESPDSVAVNLFEQYFEGINRNFTKDQYGINLDFTRYDKARRKLINALENCGEENGSALAYDLAAGNFMDVMKLRYKEYWTHEGIREDLLSYLINANLDQEAFDFLMYFYLRRKTQEPLPYLSIEPQDIEASFTQSEINDFPLSDTMVIALVKYKRMRHLEFQELCEAVRFKTFMMGTHLKVGKNSPVLKIRGVSAIVSRLSDFILKPLKQRVLKLHEDIEIILKSANTSNRYVIPGLLNPESLPPIDNRPMWLDAQGLLQGHGTKEEGEEDLKVRDAWIAVDKTDRAWRLAMLQDIVFLEGFLSRGSLPNPSEMPRMQIMVNELTWKGRECNLTSEELYGHSYFEVLQAMEKADYLSLEENEEKDEGILATANEFMEENGGKKGKEIVATANEEVMEEKGEGNREEKEATANAKHIEGNGREKGEENVATANEEIMEENGGEEDEHMEGNRGEKEKENVATANEKIMEENGEEDELIERNRGEKEERNKDVTDHVLGTNIEKGNSEHQVNEMKKERKSGKSRKPNCARASCPKKGRHRCARCKAVFYCHEDCLTEDWHHHKTFCDYVYEANKGPDDSTKKSRPEAEDSAGGEEVD